MCAQSARCSGFPNAGGRASCFLPVDGVAQAADVADGVETTEGRVAGALVAVAFYGGHMVRPRHALESDFSIRAHALQQIGLTRVVPRLLELLGRPAHVSEVHEEHLILATELTNRGWQVVGHQREVPWHSVIPFT